MATEQDNSFPTIPIRQWWSLRECFRESIPATVTAGYIAGRLKMSPDSAKANVLRNLVKMGLVDQDGKPLNDNVRRWRDDAEYSNLCAEIRRAVYPQELLDIAPGPVVDRDAVKRWFARETGAGEVAQNKMTSVYEMLCEADPAKAPARMKGRAEPETRERTPRKTVQKARARAGSMVKTQSAPLASNGHETAQAEKDGKPISRLAPEIHINIQIHISPEAAPAQIDQIFASMAKHLGMGGGPING